MKKYFQETDSKIIFTFSGDDETMTVPDDYERATPAIADEYMRLSGLSQSQGTFGVSASGALVLINDDATAIRLAQSQSAMAGLVKSQATFAGLASEPHFMPLMIECDLVKPALEIVQQIENENIVNQARGILLILQKTITTFHYYGFPFSHLPNLEAFNLEDGSTLVEWIFDDFRIGFSVESDKDESSWYLVSSKKLREINASGYIPSGNEFEKLILWLLNFVISHT